MMEIGKLVLFRDFRAAITLLLFLLKSAVCSKCSWNFYCVVCPLPCKLVDDKVIKSLFPEKSQIVSKKVAEPTQKPNFEI